MKFRVTMLFAALLMLLLVACGPSEPDAIAEPDEAVAVSPTEAESEAAVDSAESAADSDDEMADDDTVAEASEDTDAMDAADESEDSMADDTFERVSDYQFPATTIAEAYVVRDRDHIKGATDPDVVLIEYGDFQ